MRVVTLLSGGLDSTTLLYWLMDQGNRVVALSFDYGQRHKKELQIAAIIAKIHNIHHHIIDLSQLGPILALGGSSLVNSAVDVPEGHYAADNMAQTVVPNRNAIMLSIAFGVAIAYEYPGVAFAPHSGDHEIYPDCRREFIKSFAASMWLANQPHQITLIYPFVDKTKAEIVSLGASLEVPFNLTWSCYKGGAIHCGRCGTCVERAEAFSDAGIEDPTVYEDKDYWKGVVNGRI